MGNIVSAEPLAPSIETCLRGSIPTDLVATKASNWDYIVTNVRLFNLDVPVMPLAVVYPKTNEQVAAAIKCASEWGAAVQTRSGGHSYGNHAYGGGYNNTVTIDLENMKHMRWDKSRDWVAHVGAGLSLGELDKLLMENGGRAMAHGTCPGVGSELPFFLTGYQGPC